MPKFEVSAVEDMSSGERDLSPERTIVHDSQTPFIVSLPSEEGLNIYMIITLSIISLLDY